MDSALRAPTTSLGFAVRPPRFSPLAGLGRRCYRPITRFSKTQSWRIKCPANGGSLEICASSGSSKRRAKAKSSIRGRGTGPSPEVFTPEPPAGVVESSVTSTTGVNGSTLNTGVNGNGKQATIVTNGVRIEDQCSGEPNGEVVGISHGNGRLAAADRNHLNKNGSVNIDNEGGDETLSPEASTDEQEKFVLDDDKVGPAAPDDKKCLADLGDGPKSVEVLSINEKGLMRSGSDEKNLLSSGVSDKSLVALGDDEKSLVALGDDEKSLVVSGEKERSLAISGNIQTSSVVLDYNKNKNVESGDECGSVVDSNIDQTRKVVVADEEESLEASAEGEACLLAVSSDEKSVVTSTKDGESAACLDRSIVGSALIKIEPEQKYVDAPETELEEVLDDESDASIDSGEGKTGEAVKEELLRHFPDAACEMAEDDSSHKLNMEKEAQMRTQIVEELSKSTHKKLFTYPQAVRSGEDIEVFFNLNLSSLMGEPDVLIKGAYNDWRWKSFTIKMNKSHLCGDWWSCKTRVPTEAYKMDFVFYNGKNTYDNNNKQDFHIAVEGGMDPVAFESFLTEEKEREHEQLDKDREEKNRQTEEDRLLELERAATEATRAQAIAEVERGRTQLQNMMKKAKTSLENVWHLEPCKSEGENLIRLYYNRGSGSLAHSSEIWIHGGINNWRDGLSVCTKLVKSEKKDADWWYAEVCLPDQAFILDWVFANGPPQKANVYDNNQRQDFHAVVPKPVPEEIFWEQEKERLFRKLQEERQAREGAIRAKAEKTAQMKAKIKERTLKMFLMSQKHIFYTDPLEVQAGENVTVYYNPANTVLNGKPEVWFRCSFNRWNHHGGPLAPQKMVPADNGSHTKTIVKVPLDAYMMDFVFSEKEDGGVFDNKGDMDYHVPVYGGTMKEPSMHVVHIAIEMAPIAKVGGLGDVVTSLSRAVQDLNHRVDVILPKYNCLNLSNVDDFHYKRSFPWGGIEIKVWFGKVEGLPVYFLEPCNGLFSGGIYSSNDAQRFSFFCHAALEFLKQNGSQPDIIHCHDWSSAPVAWLFKEHYQRDCFSKTRVVFTVHNLEYGAHFIGKAMQYSDKATTVSHTYSGEITGNPAISANRHKFHGILNGIDPDIWDPFNDKFLPVPYTSENVVEGKKAAKEALQRKLGLKVADIPLVGVVSRLTHQKGIHLIKHAIGRTLERNGQFILLGCAPDSRIHNDFVNIGNYYHSAHNDRIRLCLTYDEPFSHLIYGAADLILVPSMFEPCGLTQLVAMRYGAIPVVRKTGGLYDTVFDVDHDKERAQTRGLEPNGFSFEGADATGVDYALNRALGAWYDSRAWFNSLCKRVMEQDWSWNRPALDYLELYHAARKY